MLCMCCNGFQVFHVFFKYFRRMFICVHMYVASVALRCCICCTDYTCVASVCFKCFNYFKRILQVFYLDVAYVCSAHTHMS
jgi:hypothetical protein